MKAFHEEVDDFLWVTEPEVVKGRETPNLVSGVDDSLTDKELIEDARQQLKTRCSHLSDEDFERLWTVLMKHRGCWLRPSV
jgi:hypothetical protein